MADAPLARPDGQKKSVHAAEQDCPDVQAARAGCGIDYLPPYSPDRNPIENAFSKLKRLARTAAERTVEGRWQGIGRWIDQFRPGRMPELLSSLRIHRYRNVKSALVFRHT